MIRVPIQDYCKGIFYFSPLMIIKIIIIIIVIIVIIIIIIILIKIVPVVVGALGCISKGLVDGWKEDFRIMKTL